MATIKFLLQSKSNPANIYLRLSIDRNNVFKRKSGYVINPKDWSTDTNFPKPNDEDLKKLKTDLKTLGTEIEKKLNNAITAGNEISGDWLQEQIDTIQGKQKKTDLDRLTSYIQGYIDNLPFKEFPNGKRGVARGTIQKYNTLKTKIQDFEKLSPLR